MSIDVCNRIFVWHMCECYLLNLACFWKGCLDENSIKDFFIKAQSHGPVYWGIMCFRPIGPILTADLFAYCPISFS